jgi:aryl-alcohol dehydrogenase-like predicted oxidoreductase|tara:strand:- start:176 stop:610 length:435 start_codon:yes stop_codon:yes gene_type:complete
MSTAPQVRYGRIPGVEKPVSRVIYGTLFLHLAGDEPATFKLLDDIWATGCNTFDCAGIYGGGACEDLLGRWMESRRIGREEVVIISKGGCEGQVSHHPSGCECLQRPACGPPECRRPNTDAKMPARGLFSFLSSSCLFDVVYVG